MRKVIILFIILICVSCEQKPIENPLLNRFASFENRFRFFFENDEGWIEGEYQDSIFVAVKGHEKIENTNAFVVSYRNGEFLYQRGNGEMLPEAISFSSDSDDSFGQKVFYKDELHTGRNWCEVSHEASPIFKYQKKYFQTRLKNISKEKIKVIRFGTFTNDIKNKYRLVTQNNNFYSAEDFQTFYKEEDSEWIAPGASVTDPVNQSMDERLWAYQIETASGDVYWVSAMYKEN